MTASIEFTRINRFLVTAVAATGFALASCPPCYAQESTPVEIEYRFRDGDCFNSTNKKGRNEGAMVECGFVKGRALYGLAGVSLLGFFGQYLSLNDLLFLRVGFTKTRFELAKIERTQFIDSQITDSDWRGALLTSVKFENVNFKNVDLRGAKLNDVTFSNCDLSSVNFQSATFFQVRFRNSKTEGLNLESITQSLVTGLSL